MAGVIMHTRETFDENRDPRQGPQIRTEAVGPRSFAQLPVQTLNLPSIESRLAPSPTCAPQSADATSLPLFIPSTDTLAAYSQSSRDVGHDQSPSSKQAARLLAPLLQCSEIPPRTKFSRHARIISAAAILVTLLCEIQ
jgi:hypothetical protein